MSFVNYHHSAHANHGKLENYRPEAYNEGPRLQGASRKFRFQTKIGSIIQYGCTVKIFPK